MPMPNDLVFVRHGESEMNVVHRVSKLNEADKHPKEAEINDRPDWRQRLSTRGIQQAKLAKDWIDQNLGGAESFDGRYVSPFLRTRETAAYIGGLELGDWTVDDRLVERSWGIYGVVPKAEQRVLYPITARLHKETPWFVRFEGGESMPDVYGRFRDFQGTLHREESGKRVLVVSHGDFMNVVRYGVERMLPEQWEAMDSDKRYTIRNCCILHYTRVNPEDPSDVREKIQWRRTIYPDAPEESPDGGEWVELSKRQRFTGAELLKQLEISPNLLDENQ